MLINNRRRFSRAFLIILTVLLAVGLVGSTFIGSCKGPETPPVPPTNQDGTDPVPQTQEEQLKNIIADLREEAAQKPDDINVLKGLARVHLQLASLYTQSAREAEAGQELEAAAANYNNALEIDPDNAELVAELALTLTYQGKNDEALEAANRAVNIDPENVLAHYYRGVVLQARGDRGGAVTEWQTVIDIAPESEVAAQAQRLIKENEENKD